MPQVSKKYIQQGREKRIYNLISELIIKIRNEKDSSLVLNDLLTNTEKIMISKRLACYYLLSKSVHPDDIVDILKISSSTVFYYKDLLKAKTKLKNYLLDKVFVENVKQTLKDIFVEFYYNSPRKGSDWSANKKKYYEYQRSKRTKI